MILIKTTITEEKPFDVTVRAWPKMKSLAMKTVGDFWHSKYFPKHFEYSAKEKYRHQKRKTKYLIRKQYLARMGRPARRGGQPVRAPGTVDNVLTGAMEKALRSSATIKAFPTRATVKMIGPSYALMRPWKSGQPNKGQELTATTQDEREKMAELLGNTMHKLIKNFRATRKVEV